LKKVLLLSTSVVFQGQLCLPEDIDREAFFIVMTHEREMRMSLTSKKEETEIPQNY
jgi:hypothetical protein